MRIIYALRVEVGSSPVDAKRPYLQGQTIQVRSHPGRITRALNTSRRPFLT